MVVRPGLTVIRISAGGRGGLGEWDQAAMQPARQHVTIAVSGAHGGRPVDFHERAQRDLKLAGVTRS